MTMQKPARISREKPVLAALNYAALRGEGIEHIKELCRAVWTDHNVHDPGITILELLCYAITDCGFRASFPLVDILAGRNGRPFSPAGQFHRAEEILPTDPVSEHDYRRLLIDIDGVKNAWLRQASLTYYLDCPHSRLTVKKGDRTQKVAVLGVYDVLLELEADVTSAAGRKEIMAQVRAALNRHRNLCEDFRAIDIVPRQDFIVCAEIDLAPDADPSLVEAAICHAVQQLFTPPVRFYSFEEMRAQQKSVAEIFQGPRLAHGFIDGRELDRSTLAETIRLSDVINVVMGTEGVRAVRDILVAPQKGGAVDKKWSVRVDAGHQPVLNRQASRIVYYKDFVPVQAEEEKVLARLGELQEPAGSTAGAAGPEPPAGTWRDIGEYYPVRNHFPLNYGIGRAGLPDSASARRKAQARQLKAFLLFFEQILANHHVQLAHLGDLFSWSDTVDRTYFTRPATDPEEDDDLFVNPAGLAAAIQKLAEDEELFHQRRNRFLNHLLARHAEQFDEYVSMMTAAYGKEVGPEIINAKTKFLQQYPALSRQRGTAFDYTAKGDLWDTSQVTGFERRVAQLLGMRNFKRRNLAAITYDVYEERDTDTVTEYRFRVLDEHNKILLSSSWKQLDRAAVEEEMVQAVEHAMDRGNYQLKETIDNRFYFNVLDQGRNVIARRIEYFATEAERDAAIDYLIDFLHQKYSNEGFFVVEHLLLRPRKAGDVFLPVCMERDCGNLEDADPYSCRMSIILPAWSRRFANFEFRQFVEKTLRLETPAHIQPRICWVDQVQMSVFEKAYRKWLELHADGGVSAEHDQALADLVTALSGLRSVYPAAALSECDSEEGRNPFILDRNILGTTK